MVLVTTPLFGLGNDFFRANKSIDILYVSSNEGLRVREGDSFSSKKVDVLYDRMCVKVVSVGKEEVVDGIKSNWVKILRPLETLRTGHNVYGWVFGGYLTDRLSSFSTAKWTDNDLQRYLSRFSWVSGTRSYTRFAPGGRYLFGLLESGAGGEGTYSVSMKNKTITVKASYGDEEYQGAVQTLIYKILDIGEDYLLLAIDGKETKFLPAFTNSYFWIYLTRSPVYLTDMEESAINALNFSFAASMIDNLGLTNTRSLWDGLIKMGIKIEDMDYLDRYNEVW